MWSELWIEIEKVEGFPARFYFGGRLGAAFQRAIGAGAGQ